MIGRALGVALTALLTVGASDLCAQAPNAANADPVEEYRIGPEDTLLVSVWKNDAISKTVPVRPDGMVSLPLVHDVRAAGLTPDRSSAAEKLSGGNPANRPFRRDRAPPASAAFAAPSTMRPD